MFRTIFAKRGFNTIRSINDEQANQILINRLRSLPKLGENRSVEPKPKIEDDHNRYRKLTVRKLNKLLVLNLSDPIVWNSSVMSRVFDIPEEYGEILIEYTKPLTHLSDTTEEEQQQLLKNPFVVDVARLQNDEKYQLSYKQLAFINLDREQSVKISSLTSPLVEKKNSDISKQ